MDLQVGTVLIARGSGSLHIVNEVGQESIRVRPPLPKIGPNVSRTALAEMFKRDKLHIKTS